MAAEFVALADLLRVPDLLRAPAATAVDTAAQRSATVIADSSNVVSQSDPIAVDAEGSMRASLHAALRDARLFRARLADAFDDAAARLLRDLASDVLARELRLAPCDVAAIVQRVVECAPVVRVRVAACDVARTAGMLRSRGCDVSVVEDSALAEGDAVVELAGGALDARLGVRLAALLEAFA